MQRKISVCEDFSPFPGARYRINGPHSGEEFRETLLEPLFEDKAVDSIEIDLDGVDGYATSFLEETFGGLVRKYGRDNVEKRLTVKSEEDQSLKPLVKKYMREANR